jgi:DnaJ-domain-containing protein 1
MSESRAATVPPEAEAEHLLARFFFALMGEVMGGPVTPELIDEVNQLRDSWQRDLLHLRGKMLRRSPRPKPTPQPRPAARPAALVPPSLARALATLGLPDHAGLDDLQRAFRSLARQHHPDKNPGNPQAEDRFKSLNQAYRVARAALLLRKAVG